MRLEDVRKNYDRLAPRYDRWARLVFKTILGTGKERERTVALLGDVHGATILDIGCGTGSNFPLLLPKVGPEGRVMALDYSEGMLAEARKRAQDAGWSNIAFIQGDAAKLEGVPEVDAVLSVWCLGIVHDIESALHRAIDVVKPGGHLAVMDFARAKPERGILRWLYPLYSAVFIRLGIDSRCDIEEIEARWKRGRAVIYERLVDTQEYSYLQGAGIIIVGRKES